MSDESTKGTGAGANDANTADNAAESSGTSNDPLRPVGKRQVAGQASTTRAMSTSRAPEAVEVRRNPFVAIGDWFGNVVNEMRKVIWPTGREMVNYSVVVIVFLILLTTLVAGVDFLTGLGITAMFDI